jgi:hypothetical protein
VVWESDTRVIVVLLQLRKEAPNRPTGAIGAIVGAFSRRCRIHRVH